MRARFTGDYQEVSTFLADTRYPYPWPVEKIAQCLVFRLVHRGGTIGFLWFSWLKPNDILEVHVAVRPEFHGKWMNRKMLAEVMTAATLTGAKQIVAQAVIPAHERGLMKLGWKPMGLFMFTDLTDNQ